MHQHRRSTSQAVIDPDARVMMGARRGDNAALDLLVRKYRMNIVHYVYRIVLDGAVAEELAQEVFLRVHRHRQRYRAQARFTSWLYSIARNLAFNWLRDHERERAAQRTGSPLAVEHHPPAPGMSIEDRLVLGVLIQQVREVIRELPVRQRTVVVMHKFEELDCAEIGDILGCSHQAVRSLLCRAYVTLRERLAGVDRGILTRR